MVPLLPAENILDLAGNQAPYDILTTTFGDSHRFSSKVLRCARGECGLGEIDQARRLAEAFANGIATLRVLPRDLNRPKLDEMETLVERIKEGEQKTIQVPTVF